MTGLPDRGVAWPDLLERLRGLKEGDYACHDGRLPVYVYHYTDELLRISQEAYTEFFTENALGAGKAFPSVLTLHNEVVGMAVDLFAASAGTFTSGGTESIFLAMKAARDWARAEKGIRRPKVVMVMPLSAHATADKAASYLDVEVVRTPLRSDFRADVEELAAAVDERTFMIYGLSARISPRCLRSHPGNGCVGGRVWPLVPR